MPKKIKISHPTDNELVEQACKQDIPAMNKLLSRYQKKTKALIYPYIKKSSEVQDLSQEILIKLFKSIHSFHKQSSFNTWHHTIAMNTLASYYRHSSQKISSNSVNYDDFDEHYQSPITNDPQKLLMTEQSLEDIFKAIGNLPSNLQYTFILFDIIGNSYQEIATQLNCPIGTVRSRIHRARKLLSLSSTKYKK